MKIRILEPAKLDLKKGYQYYEQREQGVGTYFLDTLESEIRTLV